jgi:hypothetical protein
MCVFSTFSWKRQANYCRMRKALLFVMTRLRSTPLYKNFWWGGGGGAFCVQYLISHKDVSGSQVPVDNFVLKPTKCYKDSLTSCDRFTSELWGLLRTSSIHCAICLKKKKNVSSTSYCFVTRMWRNYFPLFCSLKN